ncbi:N-acetyltransferase [Stagonosporopsis vannaccii]|nr:N-acetyltransferase [Stagonosporopsis vannaccii]
MCFGDSDPVGETTQPTARGNVFSMKLKRRRSPPAAEPAESQDSRKLSRLDSAASTIANNPQVPHGKLMSIEEQPEPNLVVSATDAENGADRDSVRVEQLRSQNFREPTSISSESTLTTSFTHGTPLVHRTAFIEAHNAPEELRSYTFQQFIGLDFYPALRFELRRSSKMTNSELAVCFDLVSKTSRQDYQSSSLGWNPNNKMHEMADREMLYLLVRQAEGYSGVDKINHPSSSAHNTGAILGFLSFKFEPEDEEHRMMRPVEYIYELHLDDRLRGRGLGSRMLRWAESQARLVNIGKLMLTVFRVNEGARRLYEREGFATDGLSPADRVTRRKVFKADYIIMSKEL